MLRIIAGKYRGRKIATGKHLAARPTMSIVREAVFNILSSKKTIYNLNILDLFCGSGSFSFEALSRGAKHAFIVDSDYYNLQLPKKRQKILVLQTVLHQFVAVLTHCQNLFQNVT